MKSPNQEITSEILHSRVPLLIEFYADWCGPCKKMKPVIEEIEREYKGKVKVFILNIEKSQELADDFTVLNLPTFVVFRGGNRIRTLVGMQSKKSLVSVLVQHSR